MAGHPFGRPPALRDGLVFGHEFLCGIRECPLRCEEPGAGLALQGQEPVLGHVLGELEAFLLRADAMSPAADTGLAIPELAVLAFEELNVTAHQLMIFLHRASSQVWAAARADL